MRLMAVTKACVDLVLPFLRKGLPEFRRRLIPAALAMAFAVFMGVIPPVLIVVMVGLLLSITVMTFVVKAMILHSREFVADAGAIELTKNPAALISALRRIAGVEAEPIGSGFATQAMMFAGADSGLFDAPVARRPHRRDQPARRGVGERHRRLSIAHRGAASNT